MFLPITRSPNAELIINEVVIKVWVNLPEDVSPVSDLSINNISIRIKGNVIPDKSFPSFVNVQSRGWMALDSGLKGEFVFEQIYQSEFDALNSLVGQRFMGFLFPQKQVTELNWQ